jgi:hypothetical protein
MWPCSVPVGAVADCATEAAAGGVAEGAGEVCGAGAAGAGVDAGAGLAGAVCARAAAKENANKEATIKEWDFEGKISSLANE